MKKRIDVNPIKIIQILPINTDPPKQPLKPREPLLFKNVTKIGCTMSARIRNACRVLLSRVQGSRAPERTAPAQRRPAVGAPLFDEQPAGPPVSPETEHLAGTLESPVSLIPVCDLPFTDGDTHRVESFKEAKATLPTLASVQAWWSRHRTGFSKRIGAIMRALRQLTEVAGQSIVAAGFRLSDQMRRLADTLALQLGTLRLLSHRVAKRETEIIRATLLSQQRALEETTVLILAAQKELVAQREALSRLARQIAALERKLAHVAEAPLLRRADGSDGGHLRRPFIKRSSLAVSERSREHRA
jgi:hypothetical protein